MAEGDAVIYNCYKYNLMNAAHDLQNGGDTIQVILVSGYSPDVDSHTVLSDVSAYEYSSGLGYTEGGATLANQATSQDNTNNRGEFDGDDITWSNLGPLSPATPSHAIMVDVSSAGSPLMIAWELGTTPTNGGDYTLEWHTNGISTIS